MAGFRGQMAGFRGLMAGFLGLMAGTTNTKRGPTYCKSCYVGSSRGSWAVTVVVPNRRSA